MTGREDVASEAPKAFLSHASEDKERFVRGLAARLRAAGVDAWLDEWEIAGGESLVTRIFERGIGASSAFIVVLSRYSVTKPWVRAELDAAVVANIERQTKLIPLRLDNVEVPMSLQAKRWIPVADTTSYDAEFNDLLRTIFEIDVRPPLGLRPSYVDAPRITGLNQADAAVLRIVGELAIETDIDMADGEELARRAHQSGIDDDGLNLSLDALENAHLVEFTRLLGGGRTPPALTMSGWRRILPALVPDIDELRKIVIGSLVNEYRNGVDSRELSERLNRPRRVIVVLLRELKARRLLTLSEWLPNGYTVAAVSPLLARELSD